MFKLHFVQLMNIFLLSLDIKIKDDYSLYFYHFFYMTIFIYKNMTTIKRTFLFSNKLISETKKQTSLAK